MTRRRFLVRLAAAGAAAGLFPFPAGARDTRLHIVRITDFAFVPAELTVAPGDRIRWINDDLAPHTATANDRSWDTGRLDRGDETALVVTPEMTGAYFCRFHPAMKGMLRVRKRP